MRFNVLFLGFVVGVLLVVGCGGALVHQSTLLANTKNQRTRTVKVSLYCKTNPAESGTGSGVIIDRDHVLTAGHVVDCPDSLIVVRGVDGMNREALVEMISYEADVARLLVAGPAFPVSPIRVGPVSPGDSICMSSGYPEALDQCGKVTVVLHVARPGNVAHTIKVVPGNSGSPVYDVGGRLVGIMTHRTASGGLFSSIDGRDVLSSRLDSIKKTDEDK